MEKNLALSVEIIPQEKTLTDKEIDNLSEKLFLSF